MPRHVLIRWMAARLAHQEGAIANPVHEKLQAVADSLGAKAAKANRTICFLACDDDDEDEVRQFVETFGSEVELLVRGVSANDDFVADVADRRFVLQEIDEAYFGMSTVTIVLVGRNTYRRRFVDWEIAVSLDTSNERWRNALVAIWLRSAAGTGMLPDRLGRNIAGAVGYVLKPWRYPKSAAELNDMIAKALKAKAGGEYLVDNSADLMAKDL